MVIKDILNKVSKPGDPDNPQVKALREKLAKLQQKKSPVPDKKEEPKPETPSETKPAAQPAPQAAPPSHDKDIEALAKASEREQRNYVQRQDPELKLQEERTHKLVAKQINELIELATELNKRIVKLEKEKTGMKQEQEKLEAKNNELVEKMDLIDHRLEKFMGLYEVITNKYNPFAGDDAVKADMDKLPEGDQVVKVDDSLTGEKTAVPIEQGQMSTENQEKINQLLADLEDQEKTRAQGSSEEMESLEVREEETQKDLMAQMHQMMDQYENRIKQHIDSKVEEKLHESMEEVETVLKDEVDAALNEDLTKLKENEDIVESALKEIASLENDSPAEMKETTQEFSDEIHSIDEQIKAIPPSLYFRLQNGQILKNKEDLKNALESMEDSTFNHHVNDQHNDFADWLELALKETKGEELRGKTRDQMLNTLRTML